MSPTSGEGGVPSEGVDAHKEPRKVSSTRVWKGVQGRIAKPKSKAEMSLNKKGSREVDAQYGASLALVQTDPKKSGVVDRVLKLHMGSWYKWWMMRKPRTKR
ncbi:hypothetical protein T492DRAFT_881819 [Pavlovales sp. CCMP2436]|nr:hypothetical protein T492DRAFT_881819 [Pavlovales sp. CCMP2436]